MKLFITKTTVLIILVLMIISSNSFAQYQPLIAQHYQNRYLSNSSMAGIAPGSVMSSSYRGHLSSVEGSPENQVLTGSFRVKDKVGLGFQLSNISAGLLGSLGGKVTYAYHLPISDDDHQLHMGVSAGFQKDRFDQSGIEGSTNADPLISQYMDRGVEFQGDFGLGYNYKKLMLQLSLPTLGKLVLSESEQVGYPTFYGAASYKFGSAGVEIEPMLSVMGVQSGSSLVGLGTRVGLLDDKLQLTGYYHSNSTFTTAVGYNLNERYFFLGGYNISGQQAQGFVHGSFELGLSINFNKKGAATIKP